MIAFTAGANGAVLMDQIGNPETYSLGVGSMKPSQIAPVTPEYFDPTFDSSILEDFTVDETTLQIAHISALFQAQGGFASFAEALGYRVDIFSDPALAADSLVGDVASQFIVVGGGASVTQIPDASLIAEYGLVDLDVSLTLASANRYWLAVSVVAPFETGMFFLQHSGASVPGNLDAKFANPEDGFGLTSLSALNLDYAYSISSIPEPALSLLGVLSTAMLLIRRKRGITSECPNG